MTTERTPTLAGYEPKANALKPGPLDAGMVRLCLPCSRGLKDCDCLVEEASPVAEGLGSSAIEADTHRATDGAVLDPCPSCGALPCDWVDNPHWRPVSTAPRDGSQFIAYSQDTTCATGLNPFVSLCAWHPDAGFCTCELREVTHWMPLPAAPDAVSPASQPGMNDGEAGENAPSLPEASPVGGGEERKLSLQQRLRNYAACYPDHPALAAVLNEAAQALAVMSPRDEE